MPELFTITDEWSEQFWFSTGGTRAKKYLQSPDGKFYYFKQSQHKPATETKPGKNFTYEFWNEIIAYELGTMLGFNMLRYDIATDGEVMGCISESMINGEMEELVEGVKYLQAFSPTYDPAKKEHQTWYTFDMIKNSLESKYAHFIEDIIKLIIFDSLIGNGDRHQENWAIITEQRLIADILEEFEKRDGFHKLSKPMKWIIRVVRKLFNKAHDNLKKHEASIPKSHYESRNKFAPIYDNGSSLGRELTDERVDQLLSSREELNRYIDKGLSEIHWERKKLGHFELLVKIKGTNYSDNIALFIKKIIEKFNPEKLLEIIKNVDEKVPESYSYYKIPEKRKELIFKIITLRFEKLQQLVHEGI